MRTLALLSLAIWGAVVCPAQSGDPVRDAASAYKSGDMPTAIRLYRAFLADHPEAAEIRSNLGAALVRDGKFAEAIDEYLAALKLLPRNAQVRLNLALAYYKVGRLSEAALDLELLHEMQPVELQPALLLADCYLQIGQPAKAVALLTPLLDEYPDDSSVIYMLGMALLKDGKNEKAQQILDKILHNNDSAESAYLLGQSEFIRQDVIAAATHLARAVQLNPNLPGVHSLYGQVLRGLSKMDEAGEQFRAELAVNPYDFVANTEITLQLKSEGKFDDALMHIGRALQVRPNDPGALYQRASVHIAEGKLDEACTELEQLVKAFPGFAEAHAALATVYYRLKRPADGDRERAAAEHAQDAKTGPKKLP